MKTDTTDLMLQDWDERARKDAFHYIASWRKDWNSTGKVHDRLG